MSLFSIPCIVFSGGKSSRMGEDKAFLPFGKHDSLIEYQVSRLQKIFTHVYISAKDKNKFTSINAIIIEDILHPEVNAPTTGFLNIFSKLKEDDTFFVLSVDSPFVTEEIISELITASKKGYEAVIVKTPLGIHPLCGIYTRSLQSRIQTMMQKDEHKLRKLLDDCNVCYVEVENEYLLSNLNTPKDYKKALKTLA